MIRSISSFFLLCFMLACSQGETTFPQKSEIHYFGSSAIQSPAKILSIQDKKYIIATSNSFNNNESEDLFFIVTDRLGNELFSKVYGEDNLNEKAVDIVPLEDGFLILYNTSNVVSGTTINTYALLKIDFLGNSSFERSFIYTDRVATSLTKINEEEFIITGYVLSGVNKSYFVQRISETGVQEWESLGTGSAEALKAHILPDNNILVFGNTTDLSELTQSSQQVLVFILERNTGNNTVTRFFGGSGNDEFFGYENRFNTYYVVGSSTSDFVTRTVKSNRDFLLFNFDTDGLNISEQKNAITFGGSGDDIAKSVAFESSGDLLIYGETTSFRPNVTDYDQILIKSTLNSIVAEDWLTNPRLFGSDGKDTAVQILYNEGGVFLLGKIEFSAVNENTLISLIKPNLNGRLLF